MVYCWKCGSELQSNVSFCGKCGSPGQPAYASSTNVTGNTVLDQLTANRDVQNLWLRRAVSFIIDSVIIGGGSIILALSFANQLVVAHRFLDSASCAKGYSSSTRKLFGSFNQSATTEKLMP